MGDLKFELIEFETGNRELVEHTLGIIRHRTMYVNCMPKEVFANTRSFVIRQIRRIVFWFGEV